MNAGLFVFTLARLSWPIFAVLDAGLILAFLKERRLMQVNVITCYSKADEIILAKILNEETILLSVSNFQYINILDTLVSKHSRSAVVVDGNCSDINHFLKRCGRYRVFDSKHHWLILTANGSYFDIFVDVPVNIDVEMNVAYLDQNSSETIYIVEDVYNPASRRGGTWEKTFLGKYNKINGYPRRDPRNKYWVKKNLTTVTFETMIVLPEPFEGTLAGYLESGKDRHINTFNRFHSKLVEYCSHFYNFSMKRSVHKSWGYLQADGTFDGMVGALERRKIDFGLSPLFVKKHRSKVITYGRLTWILRAAFIFRDPKTTKSMDIFVKPLSPNVWILIFTLLIISVIVLRYSLAYERRKQHKEVESTWSYCGMCTVGAFCQQGATSTPDLMCGRIAIIFTFLLAVLVYQFYSASLVSFLLISRSSTINTIQDLAQSSLRSGCEDILYDRDYFKVLDGNTNTWRAKENEKDPKTPWENVNIKPLSGVNTPSKISNGIFATDNITLNLYQKITLQKGNESFLSPSDGLSLVEKGNYAFHVELATAYPIINGKYSLKTICELREVPMFAAKQMHAPYPKHSSFKDLMDVCFQKLAEHGIIDKERKYWHPRKPECIQNAKTITINTGLQEFFSALVILGTGIILSLIILVFEVFLKLRESSSREGIIYPYTN